MDRKCPNLCQDTLGNEPKRSWRPIEHKLRVLLTLWEMPKEDWRPFQQCLESSEDTLENAQTKVEARWLHFPLGCQQETRKPPQPKGYRVLAYFRQFLFISSKHGGFMYLHTIWRHNKKFKSHQGFFSYFCAFQLYQFQPNSNWCDSPFNVEIMVQNLNAGRLGPLFDGLTTNNLSPWQQVTLHILKYHLSHRQSIHANHKGWIYNIQLLCTLFLQDVWY